jgi:hypothetical protein
MDVCALILADPADTTAVTNSLTHGIQILDESTRICPHSLAKRVSMNKYPIGCVQMHLDPHRTDFVWGETYDNSISRFEDWVSTNSIIYFPRYAS